MLEEKKECIGKKQVMNEYRKSRIERNVIVRRRGVQYIYFGLHLL
jgi:hypothetical protein